jgi:hypothetical protein
MRRGQVIVGSDERHMGGAEPSQEVFFALPLIGSADESLNQNTNVCAICV